MAIRVKNKVGRNDPCSCGSKLKFKLCHGDTTKQMLCNRVANEHMVYLVQQEQIKRGILKLPYKCNGCGKQFVEPKESELIPHHSMCPFCMSTDIVEQGE